MPDIYVYSTDPGKEVRTSKGSVINAIAGAEQQPEAAVGVAVLGVVGTPANDRGAAGLPVLLSGTQEIFSRWGGFKAHVGDGAATGYNGNVAALLDRLRAQQIVFSPVDMALKDKSISDPTAVDLKVAFARGSRNFTAESDTEVFTTSNHGLAVDDTIEVVTLSGGTGLVVGTTYFVKTAPDANTFTLSATEGGATLELGVDGSGVWRPVSVAAGIDLGPRLIPAGSRLATGDADSFIVRTLEDLQWAAGEYGAKEVRIAKVSGTEADINTLAVINTPAEIDYVSIWRDVFAVGELADSTLVVCTTNDTEPDEVTSAEVALRYQAAMDTFNANLVGQSATIMVIDRTEADINDALAAHCAESTSEGLFRICVVAPPVGTSVAEALADDNDGVRRPSLNGEYAIFVHPGFRRRFPLDGSLSASNDYKATFPGQALLAAKMLGVRPEENPTFVETEPGTTYGAAELELVLTREQKVAHFQAGIVTPVFERVRGRLVMSWRDGIMASGEKIARKRLRDFLTQGLIARATPYHKRIATPANQQRAFDSCNTWLIGLENPSDQRIFGHELTTTFDGQAEEFTVQADVVELGSLDIITIRVGVRASGFTILSTEE